VALGSARHANPLLVYRECGLVPLTNYRELHTAQYMVRASGVIDHSAANELHAQFNSASDQTYITRLNRTPNVARRGLAFYDYVGDTLIASGIDLTTIEKQSLTESPPWTLSKPEITTSFSTHTKSTNPNLLISLAKERLDSEYKDFIKVYTDGSKLDNGNVGCAYVIPEQDIQKKFRLNNGVSIFTAEVIAIHEALKFLEAQQQSNRKIAILSDSKSALQALNQPGKNRISIINECNELMHNLLQNNCSVSLCWVPSHSNIYGNELADRAAKLAASMPQVTLDVGLSVSEAYSKLKAACLSKWTQQFKTLAQQKQWVDPNVIQDGIPKLKRHLFPVFHRLRTRATKADYVTCDCTCGTPFNYPHIFDCQHLMQHFNKTKAMLAKEGRVLDYTVLSLKVTNLNVLNSFLREICHSPVGNLI
jgi:ribonuclease HI